MKRQWMEQMLAGVDDKYIAEVMEEDHSRGRTGALQLRNCAAAAVICIMILGSGISALAAVSDTFRNWIEKTFLGHEITEVELVRTEAAADLPWDDNGHLSLAENVAIHGQKESFLCRYHMEDMEEVVDQVYSIQDNGLKKMKIKEFRGDYDGTDFRFSYVVINKEIFAFAIEGACDQIFHYVDGDAVYAALSDGEEGTVSKGCVARLDLKTGGMTKLTDDRTWGNMVMSPNGKRLLINDRAEYYWTVLDLADGKEKRIDEINGYAHTNEVIFKGDDQVLTLGDTYMEGSVEMTGTKLVDLRTGKAVASYEYGDFYLEWSCEQTDGVLEIQNVDGTTAVSIPLEEDMQGFPHPLANRGDYMLVGDWGSFDAPFYLCNLKTGAYTKMDGLAALEGNVELYYAAEEGKLLLTDGREAYLITMEADRKRE